MIKIKGLRKSGLKRSEVIEAVSQQTIFWNNSSCKHWFFDFKLNGKWIESIEINNELSNFVVNVY